MVHRQEERLADACVANASTTISQMRSARGEAQALELAETATSVLLPRLSVCSKILRPRVAWQITGVLLTSGLTAGLYWLLPVLIRRRRRLEPVTAEFPPGLQAELQSLCTTIGQPKLPRLMWSPLGIGMPLVFGSNNRHYLAFSAEFVTRLYYDAAAFRTVVLHELAHIHLRDIGKTYLTVATCCAFLLATVLPVLSVFPFVEPRWSDVPDVLVYSVLWSVTIVLVGTSVLRAREYMRMCRLRCGMERRRTSIACWVPCLSPGARAGDVVSVFILRRLSAGRQSPIRRDCSPSVPGMLSRSDLSPHW